MFSLLRIDFSIYNLNKKIDYKINYQVVNVRVN